MEGENQELINKLKQEKDWHLSCVFTDKETLVANNGCSLRKEEIQ